MMTESHNMFTLLTFSVQQLDACVIGKWKYVAQKKEETKKKITDQAKSVLTSAFDFAVTFEAGLTFAHKMGG